MPPKKFVTSWAMGTNARVFRYCREPTQQSRPQPPAHSSLILLKDAEATCFGKLGASTSLREGVLISFGQL